MQEPWIYTQISHIFKNLLFLCITYYAHTHVSFLSLTSSQHTVLQPILQMRKLRFAEARQPFQDHAINELQSHNVKSFCHPVHCVTSLSGTLPINCLPGMWLRTCMPCAPPTASSGQGRREARERRPGHRILLNGRMYHKRLAHSYNSISFWFSKLPGYMPVPKGNTLLGAPRPNVPLGRPPGDELVLLGPEEPQEADKRGYNLYCKGNREGGSKTVLPSGSLFLPQHQ